MGSFASCKKLDVSKKWAIIQKELVLMLFLNLVIFQIDVWTFPYPNNYIRHFSFIFKEIGFMIVKLFGVDFIFFVN